MALILCKECNKEISDKAEQCPNCGAKPYKPSGCFLVIVAALVFFGVTSLIETNNSTKNKTVTPPNPIETAPGACMLFIKQVLNDPDSAQFPNSSNAIVEVVGENTFKVKYPLRAKNKFNALVKTTFECHIKFDGAEWRALSVFELKN